MAKQIDFDKIEKAAKARKTASKIIVYAMLALWGIIVLFPFYWMILTSVKNYNTYNSEHIPKFFTLSPTLQNYFDAFSKVDLGKYFLNTVIFTVAT